MTRVRFPAALVGSGLALCILGWILFFVSWNKPFGTGTIDGNQYVLYSAYLDGRRTVNFASTEAQEKIRDAYIRVQKAKMVRDGAYGLGGALVVIGLVVLWRQGSSQQRSEESQR